MNWLMIWLSLIKKAWFSNRILGRLLILLIESFWKLFVRLRVLVFFGDLGSGALSLVLIILSLLMVDNKGKSSIPTTCAKVTLSHLSYLFWLLIVLIIFWLTVLVWVVWPPILLMLPIYVWTILNLLIRRSCFLQLIWTALEQLFEIVQEPLV